METRDSECETDTTRPDLGEVRSQLERLVEHRVLGGLTEREQRRYEELAREELRLLRDKAHRAIGR